MIKPPAVGSSKASLQDGRAVAPMSAPVSLRDGVPTPDEVHRSEARDEATVGDREWIEAIVAQYETLLTAYATRLLAGDIERARDVVQDTFVKLWTADCAEVQAHLGQWLYRVCRNRALDVRKKEMRMTTLSDEHLDIAGTIGVSSTATSSFTARAAEHDGAHDEPRGPLVLALLDSLNHTQQEVLRLKFQGGLSYQEIATVMDLKSNHVGVLIHNAIKALRERMLAQSQLAQPGQVEA